MSMLTELFNKFANVLCSVLPRSPFSRFIEQFSNLPFLAYLNWFIPVKSFLIIGASWLGVIAIFYLYSIIMRWVKMIGD